MDRRRRGRGGGTGTSGASFQVVSGRPASRDQGSSEAGGGGGGLVAILKQSRKSGQLNLSNRQLTEVPSSVWRINIDTPEEGKTISLDNADDRWWEQVDLTKLILASNAISSLSDDLRLLPALTVLDLHDNRLTCLPDALCELRCLTRLNVSHNELNSLPKDLPRELVQLQTLHLQNNRLTSLPDDIGSLAKLDDLDVSRNQLTHLPADVGCLIRLMKLNIAGNQLQVVPHEIGNLRGLKVLEATHNDLHTLPDEMGFLRNLEMLYLQHNQLTQLPRLELCTSLKELHLGYNSIRAITTENLAWLSGLSFLDLRDNRLSKIPDEIQLLQSLERLDLTNNDLSMLPFVMGTMVALKSIVIEGNSMKSIRRDIVMRGTNELKRYLQSRIEAPKDEAPNAKEAPKAVASRTDMNSGVIGASTELIDKHRVASTKTLEYCEKKMEKIADDVWDVAISSGVTNLNFSKNALTSLPENLLQLTRSLNELNFSFNKMAHIEPFIGKLEKLVFLDLSHNQLNSLPDEMVSLQSLRELIISFNRFQNLPSIVYKLKKIEVILARDNKIESIEAEELIGLSVLATLDLQNNNISHVPPQLGNCSQLRCCQLEGNPFRQPRAAVLAKGTGSLLEYLRDRIPT